MSDDAAGSGGRSGFIVAVSTKRRVHMLRSVRTQPIESSATGTGPRSRDARAVAGRVFLACDVRSDRLPRVLRDAAQRASRPGAQFALVLSSRAFIFHS